MGGFIASPAGSQLPFNPRREPKANRRPVRLARRSSFLSPPSLSCHRRFAAASSRRAASRLTTPRHASPRLAAPRRATPRHARPRHTSPRFAMPRHAPPGRVIPRLVLAWLARKPPTFVHHFPAIHGDSAQTKGTVLLSILSSSYPHRLQHLNHTFHFWSPATGMSTSRSQPGGNTQTHKTRCTSDAVHS